MESPLETFERILDGKLVDLNSQYLAHMESGDDSLSELLEEEAMSICQAYENGEKFLILNTSRLK